MRVRDLSGLKKCCMLVAVAAVISLIPAMARAEDVFAELSGLDQVESTYVSGRFSHNKKAWYNNSGTRAMDLSKGFSALYTYEIYSEEGVRKAESILNSYLKKNPELEVVMKTKNPVEEYVVYEKFTDDDKVAQMIIWNKTSPSVCEIVVIDWKNGLERNSSKYH